jgi:hypothetical protein
MRVPGASKSEGTPRNILPAGDYDLEVTKVTVKEKKDVDGVVTGHNWSFQFTVEDALSEANEKAIGATYFENVFVMTEDHPKFDEPLPRSIEDRTIGDLGVDQFVDLCKGLGYTFDDDEVEPEDLEGLSVRARVRVRANKETDEPENVVRKWMPIKGE